MSCSAVYSHSGAVPVNADSDSPSQSSAPQPKAEPHEAPQQTHAVDLVTLQPYFTDAYGGVAALALAEDQLKTARDEFEEIARVSIDDALRTRAAFLAAYLALYTGDPETARTQMPAFAQTLPILNDVIFEVSAQAARQTGYWEASLKYASQIHQHSLSRQLMLADAHRHLGHYQQALELYDDAVVQYPNSNRIEELRYQMVQCASNLLPAESDSETAPKPSVTPEGSETTQAITIEGEIARSMTFSDDQLRDHIVSQTRILASESPNSHYTAKALALGNQYLIAAGQKPVGVRREPREALKLYDFAEKNRNKRRNEKAEQRYGQVVKIARDKGDLQCNAMYNQALMVSFQRDHNRAAELFAQTAKHCDQPQIKVKALYKDGKSRMSTEDYEGAIASFERLQHLFPAHSYADDARLHAAKSHLALGHRETFMELLLSIPDTYPGGDMSQEALWQGAKEALNAQKYQDAHQLLSRYFELFPLENGWYFSGRSGYWLARVEEHLGHIQQAKDRYEYVMSTSPLTYYMLLAHSRLHLLDPARDRFVLDQLAPISGQEKNTIDATVLEQNETFAMGVELVRMGLVTRGKRVLTSVLTHSDATPQMHRAVAARFRHAGLFAEASQVTKELRDGWKDRYPVGPDYESWTLSYPMAFDEEVSFAATESNVPKQLLWAVMREESGFNHKIESWANAIGLMQLIMPTARSMGSRLGIKVSRKNIRIPKLNIRLGAAYLGYLKDLNGNHPALMISGYNAGGGSVSKWRRESPERELDLYVENIPYSQTRGYTKRVLSSYAVYHFLYSAKRTVPYLDFELPE